MRYLENLTKKTLGIVNVECHIHNYKKIDKKLVVV